MDWWDNSQEDRTKGEEELRPFEEAGWWYSGIRKTGPRRGVTRDVRNAFTKVLVTTRNKRDHIVEGNTPKREDEGPTPQALLRFHSARVRSSQHQLPDIEFTQLKDSLNQLGNPHKGSLRCALPRHAMRCEVMRCDIDRAARQAALVRRAAPRHTMPCDVM